MLSLAAIQGVKLETTTVDVPEWGGAVAIQKLSVSKRDKLADFFTSDDLELRKQGAVRTVIAAVVDGESPMFNDGHYDFLSDQDAEVITRLFGSILEFNGMGKNKEAQQKKP